MSENVNAVVDRLLAEASSFSSSDVVRVAGISRQAVHKQLKKLLGAGLLHAEGKARACRYRRAAPASPVNALRTRLEVAAAGSLYRLSARMLLSDIEVGEVTLDFTGVMDVSEEFLEEVFLVWAPAHPRVELRVAHLPARFAPILFNLSRGLERSSQGTGAGVASAS